MWILDQVGNLSVNTDNVNYIFIEKNTHTIFAALGGDGSKRIALAYYDTAKDSQKVLQILMGRIHTKCAYTEMPKKDAIDIFSIV